MKSPTSVRPRPAPEPDEGADAIDISRAVEVVKLFWREARRRRLVTAAALLVGALVTAGAALSVPSAYTEEAKILAQRQVSIPALANAQHAEPADPDAATRSARETKAASEAVLRRDNLLAIIRETKLVERWDLGRSPGQRLLTAVGHALSAPVTDEDKERAMMGILEKQIGVRVDDATVTLSVTWHEPEVGHQILSCLLRNFLADRDLVETAAIKETITLLEGEAARQRESIDAALAAAEEAQRSAASARTQTMVAAGARSGGGLDETKIAIELADKRRTIQAVEDARQRRLSDLHAELDRLRVAYTSGHPMVVAMEERIRSASAPPAELADLKRQEGAILSRARGAGGRVDAPVDILEQPKVAAARIKLVAAVNKYEDLVGRLDAARLDLDAAQATFKYRYVVAAPPELPRRPDKPILLFVFLAGTLLSAAAALSAAGVRELARGRFIDPREVGRRLPIPLLAEVEEP